MTGHNEEVRYSAAELASLLGLHPPTEQQRRVIEAPLAGALVIAGAGSGKTETMATRVVWLVANRIVAPTEILGLTFTNKAARELTERIQGHLERLRVAEAAIAGDAGERAASTGPLAEPVDVLELFESVTVMTYNAFGAAVFRDHAAVLGREPGAALMGEAAAWVLARSVVLSATDDRLAELEKSVGSLTDAVLRLSATISDHAVDLSTLRRFPDEFARVTELALGPGARGGQRKPVVSAVTAVQALDPLLDLVVEYRRRKDERGVLEFSDQVAWALEVCERAPAIAAGMRHRWPVVILDEYQDTSVLQTRLLSTVFAGGAVMAVGDPNQAIYGWRGASAANLSRFARDFAPRGDEPAAPAPVASFALSTSWRNPGLVLDAANTLVSLLDGGVDVERLVPSPAAPAGRVDVIVTETVDDEAKAVAGWFASALATARRDGADAPTAAVLTRNRAAMRRFALALGEAGVPYRVVGLGGLLDLPEVVDLVSALAVVNSPLAANELVRVLTGGRWRIGVADLDGLARLARRLASGTTNDDEPRPELTLIDALDALRRIPDDSPILRAQLGPRPETDDDADSAAERRATPSDDERLLFTDVGLARLRDAAESLARLRQRRSMAPADLIAETIVELRLDLEAIANDGHERGTGALDEFQAQVAAYAQLDPGASLTAILQWAEHARSKEKWEVADGETEPGVVQLLTVHASKGLEWDLVAVPNLIEGTFPARPREGSGWLRVGELPSEFRGDALDVPQLAWREADDQKHLVDLIASYQEALVDHRLDEERRLAYVAVTRSARSLLLSAGLWRPGVAAPGVPSRFLTELVGGDGAEAVPAPIAPMVAVQAIADVAQLPQSPVQPTNPYADTATQLTWPRDPLGARRNAVESAARSVQAAAFDLARVAESGEPINADRYGRWRDDLELLLAERHASRERASTAPVLADLLPSRLAASGVTAVMQDPRAAAQSAARPVPQQPHSQRRIGTLFHAWVEQRFRRAGAALARDEDDAVDDDGDVLLAVAPTDEERRRLDDYVRRFEASEWADVVPDEVEYGFSFDLGGKQVVSKIDALYRRGERVLIMDWKTGSRPNADRLAEYRGQLAAYRLGYSQVSGVPLDLIDAAAFFVGDGHTEYFRDLPGMAEFVATFDDAIAAAQQEVAREFDTVRETGPAGATPRSSADELSGPAT